MHFFVMLLKKDYSFNNICDINMIGMFVVFYIYHGFQNIAYELQKKDFLPFMDNK